MWRSVTQKTPSGDLKTQTFFSLPEDSPSVSLGQAERLPVLAGQGHEGQLGGQRGRQVLRRPRQSLVQPPKPFQCRTGMGGQCYSQPCKMGQLACLGKLFCRFLANFKNTVV
jgi:hypothetical protein